MRRASFAVAIILLMSVGSAPGQIDVAKLNEA
jgi:hypothetical protein